MSIFDEIGTGTGSIVNGASGVLSSVQRALIGDGKTNQSIVDDLSDMVTTGRIAQPIIGYFIGRAVQRHITARDVTPRAKDVSILTF